MSEYRNANRQHAQTMADYQSGLARQTRADHHTARRHVRQARLWLRAVQAWG